jgi:hypothetical protein
MGLLDNITHKSYYQGNDLGNYQFTSLDDIIKNFMIVYVGENKIIPKAKKTDVAFHAQRALQELSFDTFKSIKTQQIDLPASLTMPLPHDYVNYTRIMWVDSSGIKHPLYPTRDSQNPFQIRQDDNGDYSFPSDYQLITNDDFSIVNGTAPSNWTVLSAGANFESNFQSSLGIDDGKLKWSYVSKPQQGTYTQVGLIYQTLDVSDLQFIDISADGVTGSITYTNADTTTGTATSFIRFGLSTTLPDGSNLVHPTDTTFTDTPLAGLDQFDISNSNGDKSYLEWTGTEDSTKELENLDVTNVDTVYVIALSFIEVTTGLTNGFALKPVGTPNLGTITGDGNINSLDNVSVKNNRSSVSLQSPIGNETESSTWKAYKSTSPSEIINDDYEDDTYWPANGERYGLDPQNAQVNGSFYIDERLGRIHFSSNTSGKTIVLDYISDSLGTDAEMQVHKFAEEAMYKWISHAMLSGMANIQEYVIQRYKKERFAAVRTAKLRLSNIKLEELTQTLRGKSKQIKH